MNQILVYADSLTWGIIPNTRNRLPFEERWPGVVENKLNASGHRLRLIEDCLNGRRTVWDDPFKPGRKGLAGLAQRIEINSPLSLVILMLGTNDFQFSHPYNDAWSAAQGMATLVNEIRNADLKCTGLAEAYAQVAASLACHFFDAQTVTSTSDIDGVHLDADQHLRLGSALAETVRSILF